MLIRKSIIVWGSHYHNPIHCFSDNSVKIIIKNMKVNLKGKKKADFFLTIIFRNMIYSIEPQTTVSGQLRDWRDGWGKQEILSPFSQLEKASAFTKKKRNIHQTNCQK